MIKQTSHVKKMFDLLRSNGIQIDETLYAMAEQQELRKMKKVEEKVLSILPAASGEYDDKTITLTLQIKAKGLKNYNAKIMVGEFPNVLPDFGLPLSTYKLSADTITRVQIKFSAENFDVLKILDRDPKFIATVACDGLSAESKEFRVKPVKKVIEKEDQKTVGCSIDLIHFFLEYKNQFKELNKVQKLNLELIFQAISRYYNSIGSKCNRYILSYLLATIKHETADSYAPIDEYGGNKYYEEMYDPVLGKNEKRRSAAKANGNTSQGDGVKYHGRGFVQLTWKSNYKKMGDHFDLDLENYPEKVKDFDLGIKILIYGSENAKFTEYRLSDFINNTKQDYFNARRVINGTDKADIIENYAIKFESCIKV